MLKGKQIGATILSLLMVMVTLTVWAQVASAGVTTKIVPWVSGQPQVPHTAISGRSIALKGTSDRQGDTVTYVWAFGDTSANVTGTVGNMYAVEASHIYTGATGTVFTANLTITDSSDSTSSSQNYFVKIEDDTLTARVNIAIDEGLWYLHKTQARRSPVNGVIVGDWYDYLGNSSYNYPANTAANVNAFEVTGHLENGDPNDPYTETVQRGIHQLLLFLFPQAIAGTRTTGLNETFTPDTNGNGYGLHIGDVYPGSIQGDPGISYYNNYQLGMFIDAFIATGNPNGVAATGMTGQVAGRKYKDIVQDMVDTYLWSQHIPTEYDATSSNSNGGAWSYSPYDYEYNDNSVSQWAAIGLIPAQRNWSISIPAAVKNWNKVWLTNDSAADGTFGYNGSGSFAWGSFATTPSGLVQLSMDGVGRGNNLWDNAETYYRNNFCNDPAYGAYSSPRAYYYGMFSFVKSMILHDPVGNGVAQPITLLKSATPGVSPIDWYSAQASAGDQCDGVAQTLVHDQNPGAGQGYWFGHNYSGEQDYFETAQAIIMLNRTLFSSAPVALPVATPNPLMINQTVTLDGSGSYHQDPSKHIVQWDWDFDNNGTFDATGPIVTTSFPTLGIYPVKLRVTDDGTPAQTAEAYVNVNVTIPPIAPTANAGGPYNFCPQTTPWILNGSKSVNPDNGQSAGAGFPGDFITSYAWDLSSSGLYTDALGVTPDVTSFFSGKNTGIYLVSLKVTDNSSKSFGLASDLSGTASAQVNLLAVDDPACGGCISNLKSLSKNKLVQLTWSKVSWANSYNIFRSTVSGGPYSQIATTSGSASGAYLDYSVTNNTTYYYVVKPTTLAGASCQSNQISAKPTAAR